MLSFLALDKFLSLPALVHVLLYGFIKSFKYWYVIIPEKGSGNWQWELVICKIQLAKKS